MYRVGTAFVTIVLLGLVVALKPDDPHRTNLSQDQRTYIGASRCKMCHRKPEGGDQFGIWENSAHSKAFEVLASEKAKELGKKVGIDNPQTADECLKCHVTGHGVAAEFLGPKYDMTEGVTCESCHGPGGDYYKKATMEGLRSGEIKPESVGLIHPTAEVCAGCHNHESPTFTGFDFEKSAAKIAHPIPEADSGDEG